MKSVDVLHPGEDNYNEVAIRVVNPNKKDSYSAIINNIQHYIKLSNIYLNHGPSFERYALITKIRNANYELYTLAVESNKRYAKKTSLNNLDILHETLRMLWKLYWELGYLNYKNNKKGGPNENSPLRRFGAINKHLDEIGKQIGGWIRFNSGKNSDKLT